jgi:integrase
VRIKTHFQVQQAVKSPPGRHSDTQVKGLHLLVTNGKNGGRNARWVYRFTKPSTGKVTELGLGAWDVLSLEQARARAGAHRRALKSDGHDPVETKRADKAERTRAQRSTFGAVAADYLAEKASGWSASHVYNVRLLLTRHATGLAGKPITSITSDDIVAALKPMRKAKPEQERRTLSAISRVFEYAEARDLCDRNPARWRGKMQARYPKRNGERKHHTAMPYSEAPALSASLHAAQEQNTALSPWALEFVLLTACRVSEVTKMRWDEVKGDVWIIPATRMKTGKAHSVPLSKRAMQLLAVQRSTRTNEFVWPGVKEGKPIYHRSLYLFLTRTMGRPYTLHGFRSTFRDWCGDTTPYAREHIEECLAHKVGGAVERAYRRGDALEKRREIMQTWSDYLLA